MEFIFELKYNIETGILHFNINEKYSKDNILIVQHPYEILINGEDSFFSINDKIYGSDTTNQLMDNMFMDHLEMMNKIGCEKREFKIKRVLKYKYKGNIYYISNILDKDLDEIIKAHENNDNVKALFTKLKFQEDDSSGLKKLNFFKLNYELVVNNVPDRLIPLKDIEILEFKIDSDRYPEIQDFLIYKELVKD